MGGMNYYSGTENGKIIYRVWKRRAGGGCYPDNKLSTCSIHLL